ncbi:hypothetical protein BPAE_0261g00090 [Botrytis paeoniae]|uniref:Cytochrome P450 n=1 Tax=Botrytis paeoniae TaxID=278948 RepID=A0A4Z1FDK1_9HELO|nr:hypothetical protein BPAE_0261g00090 [Botrytis paeoniae]
MFHIILSIFVGASALLLYAITNRQITRTKTARQYNCDIPFTYPHRDSIFGIDLKLQEIQQSLRHQSITFSANLHKKYEKTFEVINFGTSSLRSIDTENIQAFYSTNHDDWGYEPSRLSVMGPFCGRGFITTDGDTWQKARALLRPTFSKSNSRIYLHTNNEDERKKVTDFIKAFNASMIGMALSFMIGSFKFLIPKSLTTVAHKQKKTRDETVIKGYSHLSIQKSLLEGLAKQTDDRIEIRKNIIQGMMAAQGTTYVLISNTLFLLSRNPDLYERLRDEVQHLDLGASSQLFDLLRDHVFLQNILRECELKISVEFETLRIYPVFPIMNHIALRNTILLKGGGTDGESPIFAPKGTKIYTNQYALHRDEKAFGSNVESFKPDRWDSINCKPIPREYMPFGGGPRAFVGQQKALVEAAYTVAKIAQV